jgi:protein-tyrosine-phosphatase
VTEHKYNILFLCTGNSARSIIAEAIMNRIGADRFTAYSAGSHPKGSVNPHAIALLEKLDYRTAGLRSKSWDEFAASDSPELDFVITVCDDAAGEVCPAWPGQPMTAHWGMPDPAAVKGSEVEIALAFAETYRMLNNRIGAFANLKVTGLDRLSLQSNLREIGKSP